MQAEDRNPGFGGGTRITLRQVGARLIAPLLPLHPGYGLRSFHQHEWRPDFGIAELLVVILDEGKLRLA